MSDNAEEIRKHIKSYIMVFVGLMVLTVVTVGASYLELSVGGSIVLALIIASVKGSLVACYFMHLISEKKLVYWVLILTVAFFVVLMFLPIGTEADHIQVPS